MRRSQVRVLCVCVLGGGGGSGVGAGEGRDEWPGWRWEVRCVCVEGGGGGKQGRGGMSGLAGDAYSLLELKCSQCTCTQPACNGTRLLMN